MNQRNAIAIGQQRACGQLHPDLGACNVGARITGQGQHLFVCRYIAGQVEVDALEVVDIVNGKALAEDIQRVAAAAIAVGSAAIQTRCHAKGGGAIDGDGVVGGVSVGAFAANHVASYRAAADGDGVVAGVVVFASAAINIAVYRAAADGHAVVAGAAFIAVAAINRPMHRAAGNGNVVAVGVVVVAAAAHNPVMHRAAVDGNAVVGGVAVAAEAAINPPIHRAAADGNAVAAGVAVVAAAASNPPIHRAAVDGNPVVAGVAVVAVAAINPPTHCAAVDGDRVAACSRVGCIDTGAQNIARNRAALNGEPVVADAGAEPRFQRERTGFAVVGRAKAVGGAANCCQLVGVVRRHVVAVKHPINGEVIAAKTTTRTNVCDRGKQVVAIAAEVEAVQQGRARLQLIHQIAGIADERAIGGMNQRNAVAMCQRCACGQCHADLGACNIGARRIGQVQHRVICRNVAGQVEVDALEVFDILDGNALGAYLQLVAAADIGAQNVRIAADQTRAESVKSGAARDDEGVVDGLALDACAANNIPPHLATADEDEVVVGASTHAGGAGVAARTEVVATHNVARHHAAPDLNGIVVGVAAVAKASCESAIHGAAVDNDMVVVGLKYAAAASNAVFYRAAVDGDAVVVGFAVLGYATLNPAGGAVVDDDLVVSSFAPAVAAQSGTIHRAAVDGHGVVACRRVYLFGIGAINRASNRAVLDGERVVAVAGIEPVLQIAAFAVVGRAKAVGGASNGEQLVGGV